MRVPSGAVPRPAVVAVALAVGALIVATVAVAVAWPAPDATATGCATRDIFSTLPSGPATTEPGGKPSLCVLIADHPGDAYGLAAAYDLGAPDADALVLHADHPTATPIGATKAHTDRTVAWVDDTNTITGTTDLDTCRRDGPCTTTPPPAPWRLAVIIPQGDGERLHITTGGHFDIVEPTPPL